MGTPIGNLEDITLRAVRILGEVALIAAEDTRLTRRLLARHGLSTALTSFHEHTSPDRRAALVARLATGDIALVTDAGTPGVSDPGAALVADAVAAGHAVVAIPGPSAVAAALSVAGFPFDRALFIGFLPRRKADRLEALQAASRSAAAIVAFEAPHRLAAALADIAAALPGRSLVVARELTKLHEEIWRGTTDAAPAEWSDRTIKGEITLVVGPMSPEVEPQWGDDAVRRRLGELRAQGMGAKRAAQIVAVESRRPSREVYRLWDHA